MYEIENFTRPYILDVIHFENFVIGDKALLESEWEEMIFNENIICKIILDGLKETLGYLACKIISSDDFNNNLFGNFNEDKIGLFYHSGVNDIFEDNLFVRLFNDCTYELGKKNVNKIIIEASAESEELESLEYNKKVINNKIYYCNF